MASRSKQPAAAIVPKIRGKYIIIRVTSEEKSLIERASEGKCIDRSSWCRMYLVAKAKEELKDE